MTETNEIKITILPLPVNPNSSKVIATSYPSKPNTRQVYKKLCKICKANNKEDILYNALNDLLTKIENDKEIKPDTFKRSRSKNQSYPVPQERIVS